MTTHKRNGTAARKARQERAAERTANPDLEGRKERQARWPGRK